MTVTKPGGLLARALLPLAGAVGVLLATPGSARACLYARSSVPAAVR